MGRIFPGGGNSKFSRGWLCQLRNYEKNILLVKSISNFKIQKVLPPFPPSGALRKSKTHNREKQDPFKFVSVWFWCSRCFNITYIFTYHSHETWSSFILKYLLENLSGGKGGTYTRYATAADQCMLVCPGALRATTNIQARNQLWTPGGRRGFWKRPKFFKLCRTHFSKGA